MCDNEKNMIQPITLPLEILKYFVYFNDLSIIFPLTCAPESSSTYHFSYSIYYTMENRKYIWSNVFYFILFGDYDDEDKGSWKKSTSKTTFSKKILQESSAVISFFKSHFSFHVLGERSKKTSSTYMMLFPWKILLTSFLHHL